MWQGKCLIIAPSIKPSIKTSEEVEESTSLLNGRSTSSKGRHRQR
jgi:hypothetical protein